MFRAQFRGLTPLSLTEYQAEWRIDVTDTRRRFRLLLNINFRALQTDVEWLLIREPIVGFTHTTRSNWRSFQRVPGPAGEPKYQIVWQFDVQHNPVGEYYELVLDFWFDPTEFGAIVDLYLRHSTW